MSNTTTTPQNPNNPIRRGQPNCIDRTFNAVMSEARTWGLNMRALEKRTEGMDVEQAVDVILNEVDRAKDYYQQQADETEYDDDDDATNGYHPQS